MSGRARTLLIEILGDASGANKAFGDAGRGSDSFGSKLGNLAKTGAVALAGVGVAAGIASVNAISAFSDFEGQMNEVFTLLPGISQDAMDDLTGQVKTFSKDFGVLPEETVPALYQALSAGVPQDNVFEFLETAQQAAKGGVTDLTTAVDSISSVVNAYGDNISGATEASDLMFTAVRLGKTNFEELGSSLFQVVPTASALGVEFGDVTAALASMTAQGTPTSVATTQLRQAFVELGDSGTEVAGIFEEAAGKSFKQFIDEGGNTQEAMALLEQAAKDSGVGINELFGSVEAGNAALALTGEGTEAFKQNLIEMQNSSGATEAAYDQMETGLSAATDRIKANLSVLRLEVGERLAPAFAALTEFILNPGIPTLQDIGQVIVAEVVPVLRSLGDWFLNEGIPAIMTFAAFMQANVLPVLLSIGEFITSQVLPRLQQFSKFVQDNLENVMIGLAGAIVGILIPAFVLWAASAATAAAATIVALLPVIAVIATLAAVGAALALGWQTNFLGMRDHITAFGQETMRIINEFVLPALRAIMTIALEVFNAVRAIIERNGDEILGILNAVWSQAQLVVESAMSIIRDIIQLIASLIRGDWSAAWGEIQAIVATAKDVIVGTVENLKQLVTNLFSILAAEVPPIVQRMADAALDAFVRILTEGPPKILELNAQVQRLLGELAIWILTTGAPALVSAVVDGLADLIPRAKDAFLGVQDAAEDAFANAASWLLEAGKDIVRGLINGIRSMADEVRDAASGIAGDAVDAVTGALDIFSPSRVMFHVGEDFGRGMKLGIESTVEEVRQVAGRLGTAAITGTGARLRAPVEPRKSEEGYDMGRRFGMGMSIGLQDSEDEVRRQGGRLARATLGGFTDGMVGGANFGDSQEAAGTPIALAPSAPTTASFGGADGGTRVIGPTDAKFYEGPLLDAPHLFGKIFINVTPVGGFFFYTWRVKDVEFAAYIVTDQPVEDLLGFLARSLSRVKTVFSSGQILTRGRHSAHRLAMGVINRIANFQGSSAAGRAEDIAESFGLQPTGARLSVTRGGFTAPGGGGIRQISGFGSELAESEAERIERLRRAFLGGSTGNITINVTTRKADAQEIANETAQAMRFAALDPRLSQVRG